ncbi:hypothetical protein D3C85_700310 [compost metagenome]
MMAPGSTSPIKPLASTASAASAAAATDIQRWAWPRSARSTVSVAASTHNVIMPATSMSRFANCAPP